MAAVLLTLFSGIYLIVTDRVSKIANPERVKSAQGPSVFDQKTVPLEYYLAPIRKRALFRRDQPQAGILKPAIKLAPPVSAPPAAPAPAKTLSEIFSEWMVVGILQSGEPQAIVLNKKSQKTFYVPAGQAFGEINVLKIEPGRVIVGYNGETMDLSI